MRRFAIFAVSLVAALGLGAGAARSDQSPGGHLGNPDSITRGSGTWAIPIVVPTDGCVGFTVANALVFTNVDATQLMKFWAGPPAGYEWAYGWYDLSTKLSGSTVVDGQTYTLRADISLSRPFIETSAHGDGRLIVTRGDGARLRGQAGLSEWDFRSPHYDPPAGTSGWHDEFSWWPDELTCK